MKTTIHIGGREYIVSSHSRTPGAGFYPNSHRIIVETTVKGRSSFHRSFVRKIADENNVCDLKGVALIAAAKAMFPQAA